MKKLFCLLAVLLVPAQVFAWTLNWVPNTETDLAGYRVYIAPESNPSNFTFLAETTETCFELFADQDRSFFAITAFDLAANESAKSRSVQFIIPTPPDTTPPNIPGDPWITDNVCEADINADGRVSPLDLVTFKQIYNEERGRRDCIVMW